MATVTYTKYAPADFWNPFSEWYPYKLSVSKDKKTVTMTFSDVEKGATKKLVLKGSAFSISNKEITGGSITGIDALNEKGQKIVTITDLKIKGYNFRTDNLYEAKGLVLSGKDIIKGTSKRDSIDTGAGNDTVKAGSGNDYIKDFLGADTYDGGKGWDTVDYSEGPRQYGWVPAKGISANMKTGVVADPYGFKDKLLNIEEVRGTNYDDKFVGSSGDDEFYGFAGNDKIDGGGGGYDGVIYSMDADRGGKGKITVNLSKGYAIDGFGDRDTLKNIEEVSGGRFNDTIIGDKKNNYLRGGEGNDVIRGGGGVKDRLEGERGNDTLYGAKGTEDLFIFRERGQKLGTDRVKNFIDGEDKIFFRDFGNIKSIKDVKIAQSGDDVLITFSQGKIIVENAVKADFSSADFLFQ